jgi:hypothetical protein
MIYNFFHTKAKKWEETIPAWSKKSAETDFFMLFAFYPLNEALKLIKAMKMSLRSYSPEQKQRPKSVF